MRWLTVCLALGENYWREVEESNSTGSAPVHGFQDRSATNHRHLPHVKELLVAEKRLELLRPKALVSKTSVAPHYTTRPWSTECESNASNQLCRLTPNRLVFSA